MSSDRHVRGIRRLRDRGVRFRVIPVAISVARSTIDCHRVGATGFTEQSIDRVLGELATAGVVAEHYRGSRSSMYRRRRNEEYR